VKSARLIVLLLALNLSAFAAILCFFLQTKIAAPILTGPMERVADAAAKPGRFQGRSSDGPATALPPASTNHFHWGQLESEDYKTYIARLRAIGCPEQTIRDLIIADLDKLLAPEIRAAYGRRPELKYWHPEEEEMLNDVNPREVYERERQIDQRKREIIRELVNADLVQERMKTSGQEDYYERRLAFLPDQKRSMVREVLEKFDEAERIIREKEKEGVEEGAVGIVNRVQLKQLRQQRAAEIEHLLTSQEKQQYELWASPVANEVRHATYGMNATEQEFLGILQARKAFEEAWGGRDAEILDAGERDQMQQARAASEAQIRAALGDERYAEYRRAQDDDYHLLSALVTRYKLPREKAAEAYSYKSVALSYREQVQNDAHLTLPQKEEALKAIAEESRNAVRGVLGPKAFSHYVRTGQGRWLEE
jgi:hypothetical protein